MTLHGIDISHWQSGLNLAKAGVDFAIFKATDGTSYVDPTCDEFVTQAKSAGIDWGVYHFYEGSPTAEADHFIAATKGYHGHGILVLDFETHTSDVAGAHAFLDRVTAKTGIRPLIYMSQSVTTAHNWAAVADDYALWVARYASSYGSTGAWAHPAMWQYTSSGHVDGYTGNVDRDHFYGDRAAWNKFATGGKPAPAPEPDHSTLPVPDITVDGVWGTDVTRQRQTLLHNAGLYDGPIDGVISYQNPYWKDRNPGLTHGWDWDTTYTSKHGSATIRADQQRLKNAGLYHDDVDGLAGAEYFKAIQREQQTPVDGVVSHPSKMVKAMQTDGNAGHLK